MPKGRTFFAPVTLCLLALAAWLAVGPPAPADGAQLNVGLKNPPPAGTLVFRLFDSPNTFGDIRDPVKQVTRDVTGKSEFVIRGIAPGEYALMIYFDENDNGILDRNFVGIPTEPIAFSNNYRPKGPPSFKRARFVIQAGQQLDFNLSLFKALGKRGRIGVGLGVIAQSSPYRNADQSVYQVIPALTYNGARFQIYGPFARVGLVGRDEIRLAATAEYRIGAYEEDDSPVLAGLGDRKDTLMAGLALEYEIGAGFDLSVRYTHDVVDRIGGGAARIELGKSFQWGIFRFTPSVSANWLSEDLAGHDFGVPAAKAEENRPAYQPGDTLSPETGISVFAELFPNWWMLASAGAEKLDSAVTASPIVDADYLYKGFLAINYVF